MGKRHKMELLTRLIDLHDLRLGIIFCNTKRMVDDLVDHLEAAVTEPTACTTT